MKKILLLGDYYEMPRHKFSGIDKEIISIAGEEYAVDCTDDYDYLLKIYEYDLFIAYTNCWKSGEPNDEQTACLISYVAMGGKMLVIHSGLSLQRREELSQMMGGRFYSHPKISEITVARIDDNEEVTKGFFSFETVEEPYRYEFDPNVKLTFLTNYLYEGKVYPHSWKRKFGKGELIVLMNGHCLESFKEERNRIFIKASIDYLINN